MTGGYDPLAVILILFFSVIPLSTLILLRNNVMSLMRPHPGGQIARAHFPRVIGLPFIWLFALIPLTVPALMLIYLIPFPFTEFPISSSYPAWVSYWDGNPDELYTHWLSFSIMTLGIWIPCHLLLLHLLGSRLAVENRTMIALRMPAFIAFVLSLILAIALDRYHGEGPFLVVFFLFLLPILIGSGYWLEWLVLKLGSPVKSIPLILIFVVIQIGLEFLYLPSESGGPNLLAIAMWLLPISAMVHRRFGVAV